MEITLIDTDTNIKTKHSVVDVKELVNNYGTYCVRYDTLSETMISKEHEGLPCLDIYPVQRFLFLTLDDKQTLLVVQCLDSQNSLCLKLLDSIYDNIAIDNDSSEFKNVFIVDYYSYLETCKHTGIIPKTLFEYSYEIIKSVGTTFTYTLINEKWLDNREVDKLHLKSTNK